MLRIAPELAAGDHPRRRRGPAGERLPGKATTSSRPVRSRVAMSASASAAVMTIGFSRRTSRPASRQAVAWAKWKTCGVMMKTASSSAAKRSRKRCQSGSFGGTGRPRAVNSIGGGLEGRRRRLAERRRRPCRRAAASVRGGSAPSARADEADADRRSSGGHRRDSIRSLRSGQSATRRSGRASRGRWGKRPRPSGEAWSGGGLDDPARLRLAELRERGSRATPRRPCAVASSEALSRKSSLRISPATMTVLTFETSAAQTTAPTGSMIGATFTADPSMITMSAFLPGVSEPVRSAMPATSAPPMRRPRQDLARGDEPGRRPRARRGPRPRPPGACGRAPSRRSSASG